MELKDFKSLSQINDFVKTLDGLTEEEKQNLFNSMSEEFTRNAKMVKTPEFIALIDKLKVLRDFLTFTQYSTYALDHYIINFKLLADSYIKHNGLDWKVEFKKTRKDTISVYVNNILGCELNV